jgi:hypothetical protein
VVEGVLMEALEVAVDLEGVLDMEPTLEAQEILQQ